MNEEIHDNAFEILRRLYEAGKIPVHVRRVIIDIEIKKIPRIIYETLAAKKTLDGIVEAMIAGKGIKAEPMS